MGGQTGLIVLSVRDVDAESLDVALVGRSRYGTRRPGKVAVGGGRTSRGVVGEGNGRLDLDRKTPMAIGLATARLIVGRVANVTDHTAELKPVLGQ